MQEPILVVPKIHVQSQSPSIEGVRAWLRRLPTGHASAASAAVTKQLEQLNQSSMGMRERLRIMEMLRPVIDEIHVSLVKQYQGVTLPLSGSKRVAAELTLALLDEAAVGYKQVILQYAQSASPELNPKALTLCIHRALRFLAHRLVEVYALYLPAPKGLWGDLHQLYSFAEANELHKIRLDELDTQKVAQRHIVHAYKRVVLLALVNPYHLMQGEIHTAYKYLYRWADAGKIGSPTKKYGDLEPPLLAKRLHGRFVVNLLRDVAPFYFVEGGTFSASALRSFSFRKLSSSVAKLSHSVRKQVHGMITQGFQIPVATRLQQNLLGRLELAWGERKSRVGVRNVAKGYINLCTGLVAAHYHISGRVPFLPESAEANHHKHGDSQFPVGDWSKLSLVPGEAHSWGNQNLNTSGEMKRERAAQFGVQSGGTSHLGDTADRLRSTSRSYDAMKQMANLSKWQYLDQSHQGLGLCCQKGTAAKLRMGELLALQGEGENCQVATLRWLQNKLSGCLRLGVHILASSARAVACRRVEGSGSGSDYQRCLLIPNTEPGTAEEVRLIAPSALYDVGTLLVIPGTKDLLFIRLDSLLESSKSYACFAFRVENVNIPRRKGYESSLRSLME